MLGPRLGKYRDGHVHPMPGSNLSLATLGTFILWLGWFGFNPGSTMAADAEAIAMIALNTNLAAAAGCLAATAVAWIALGKPDLSMILNGTLAGLVAITAPCATVNAGSAILIGLIAGVLVVYAVLFFDRVKVDDPVGALSVHLVNGVFGTLDKPFQDRFGDVRQTIDAGGRLEHRLLLVRFRGAEPRQGESGHVSGPRHQQPLVVAERRVEVAGREVPR